MRVHNLGPLPSLSHQQVLHSNRKGWCFSHLKSSCSISSTVTFLKSVKSGIKRISTPLIVTNKSGKSMHAEKTFSSLQVQDLCFLMNLTSYVFPASQGDEEL